MPIFIHSASFNLLLHSSRRYAIDTPSTVTRHIFDDKVRLFITTVFSVCDILHSELFRFI